MGEPILYNNVLGVTIKLAKRHHLAVALYLDAIGATWHYREMSVPFVDMLSGKHKLHPIDFTVIEGDEVVWLEAQPNSQMIPTDARIYVSRRAEDAEIIYRGLSDGEWAMAKFLCGIGFRRDCVIQS